MTLIYLDNAATSYPKPESVYEAILQQMKWAGANPGRSGHKMALEAGRRIFFTREKLAELFHINNPMQVIFTANATESLNLAIKGGLKPGDHVITSSMEHNSVLRPIKALEKQGVSNTILLCDQEGRLTVDQVKNAILPNTKMIALTHASNVVGTLLPIEAIGQLAREKGLLFLVDGSQTAGVYPLDVEKMKIDLLALPGHKGLLGPQGTGILYIREGLSLAPLKEGGTGSFSEVLDQPEILPDRYESGTLNAPGIAGLMAGVTFILSEGIEKIRAHEEALCRYFLERLSTIEGITIYGPRNAAEQAPVISINVGKEDSSEIAYLLDQKYGIAIRSGLHCAPCAHRTLGTLEQGTLRFSLGYFTEKSDLDTAVAAIQQIVEQLKAESEESQ